MRATCNRVSRVFLLLGAVSLAAHAFAVDAPAASGAAASGRRPNIVLIVADDLGINDLSCYGRRDQPTPNLDRLASQGMRFVNAYAAQSVCSPTRAALMTGKAPARLHLTTFLPGRPDAVSQVLLHPNIEQQLPLAERTIADTLHDIGYATGYVGKWHLGYKKGQLPSDRGFDFYFGGKADTEPSATEGGKGEYALTAQAEKFLDEHHGKPFLLCVDHNCPHVRLAAKPELVAKHAAAFNPIYAAMIETLDDSVGRIAAKLEALGLAERTLLVFTSDNGGLHVPETPHTPATHNTPYRAGKGFLYEGGIRIPLIVRWPGRVPAGKVVDTPVISTDWVPTLLELVAAASRAEEPRAAGPLDGVSLATLLSGGEPPAARPLYWHMPHYMNQGSRPSGAIRVGDWKLIEHYEDGRLELFNLAHDISETTDLAAAEPARVAELRGQLEKWRRDVGAQENQANPDFNASAWQQLYQNVDVSKLLAESTAAPMEEKLSEWRKLMNLVVVPPAKRPADCPGPGSGVIVLWARDARVHGEKLRYEPQPHKDTLGFWVVKDDWADWEFEAPHAGTFEVQLLQGCGKGSGGAEIEVTVAGHTLSTTVEETGHFQRFVPRTIGTVKLDQPGKHTLAVKAKSKPKGAVMDLRRVTLRSAP